MEYKLVWYDDFDTDGQLDHRKWNIETGGDGFGNEEEQYYTDRLDNVYVENNRLVIQGKREKFENRNFTSAKISTHGIKSMQYGKLLVSAKVPKGKGLCPAIWMLPESFHERMRWPDCGEIDIMGISGQNSDIIHNSLNTGIFNHLKKSQYSHTEKVEGISDRFIEYGVIWTPDAIEFTVDGKRTAIFHKWAEGRTGDYEGWPFDQPFYLIINLSLGGNWGGEIDESIFPAKFEIDSVKYYEMI